MPVEARHVVRVLISPETRRLAEAQTRACCKGGTSNVRRDDERGEQLYTDNLVGQLGMIAVNRYLRGHIGDYMVNQFYANLYRGAGDGGYDFTGLNLDVKAARLTGGSRDLLDYRLAVHTREWHADWVYVLVVVDLDGNLAHIIGWATAEDFPNSPMPPDAKRFAQSFVLAGRDLNRVPPFRWRWIPKPIGE